MFRGSFFDVSARCEAQGSTRPHDTVAQSPHIADSAAVAQLDGVGPEDGVAVGGAFPILGGGCLRFASDEQLDARRRATRRKAKMKAWAEEAKSKVCPGVVLKILRSIRYKYSKDSRIVAGRPCTTLCNLKPELLG